MNKERKDRYSDRRKEEKEKEEKQGKVRIEGGRLKKVSFKDVGGKVDEEVIVELKKEILEEIRKVKEEWKEREKNMKERIKEERLVEIEKDLEK